MAADPLCRLARHQPGRSLAPPCRLLGRLGHRARSTFLIDHFDLFGLRQVYLHASGREYTPHAFKTLGLYRYVRHPLMLGFLLAFWASRR